MGQLSSRKLVMGLGGILGLLGLACLQVFGGKPLTDQQFIILTLGIEALACGGITVQGIIDYIKAGK